MARIHTRLTPATGAEATRNLKALAKSQRIKDAARALFRKQGYQETLMRDVASHAGVPEGTLFLYAREKRSLFLAILNEDLDQVTEQALAQIDPGATLIDQMLFLFEPRVAYWAANPRLSLHALQELLAAQGSGEDEHAPATYSNARRAQLIEAIAGLVSDQQRRGNVRSEELPSLVASLIMMIYLSAMRIWLCGERTDLASGMQQLRALLELAFRGITPATERKS